MKYIKVSIVILLVSFISIFAYKLTTNNSNNKISLTKEQMKEMLSYTIDGNSTSSMPTKDSGYKVKSITCKSGSILSWDNDNWLLEVEKVESEDLCNIDFTKNSNIAISNVTLTYPSSFTGHEDFSYTGSVQKFIIPVTGEYSFEVWGAQGGYRYSSNYAGKGGYSKGTISLNSGTILYIYVGGEGNTGICTDNICAGGFNGGGYRHTYKGGGGATDIRVGQDSLYARVIVAGGGGSDGGYSKAGSYGGGEIGGTASDGFSSVKNYASIGGNQTYSGYSADYTITTQTTSGLNSNILANYAGGFGFGGGGVYYDMGYGGAGGGGWYGGAGNVPDSDDDDDRGGGGGSGYIYTTSTASNYPTGCLLNSSYYLTNAFTVDGNSSFSTTDGVSTEIGHEGNGYAKITFENLSGYDFTSNFDSKSKTTTEGGKVTFYSLYEIVSVTGCDNEIIGADKRKFVVSNVTGSVTCSVVTKFSK